MDELSILRIVYAERRPFWGGTDGYTYRDLRMALGVEHSAQHYISDSKLSNILNDKVGVDATKVSSLLSGTLPSQISTRKSVETSLGLPGLFSVSNRSSVIDLIERIDGLGENPGRLIVKSRPEKGEYGLSAPEVKAITVLQNYLLSNGQPIFHWSAPINAGASIVARNLWGSSFDDKSYEHIVFLKPSDFDLPFEKEIRELGDFLEDIGNEVNSTRTLADAICNSEILVVVLAPYFLDIVPERNSMKRLITEFSRRDQEWNGKSNVLIIGPTEWLEKSNKINVKHSKRHSKLLKRVLRLKGERCLSEYKHQCRRFTNLKKKPGVGELSSRMWRTAIYYRFQNRENVWPISVKIRALFSSNTETAAYFDPTQGFKKLANFDTQIFDDITSYYEDILDYVRFIKLANSSKQRQPKVPKRYYYLLQYVSTAKHWLTEEALSTLIDHVDGARSNRLSLKTEKVRMRNLSPLITELSDNYLGLKKSKYFASVAVKAVVQDEWKTDDPYSRSLAHYRVSKRLKDNEHDKELLDREFPYEPIWGRSRLFFLSETIRHLIRSCETFQGSLVDSNYSANDSFPLPPSKKELGTNSSQVINYCYRVLYQRELNQNFYGINKRSLAKRYGAYQLSKELLELMSFNYQIGIPHPSLEKKYHAEFARECGYALLDVGELHASRECFERAKLELLESKNSIEKINNKLDLSLVNSVLGNLEKAQGYIRASYKEIERTHAYYLSENKNYAEFRQIRMVYRRLISRESHLAYLKGDYKQTLKLIDLIEDESNWKHARSGSGYNREILVPNFTKMSDPEQIHLWIAASNKNLDNLNEDERSQASAAILNRCLAALMRAQSEGLQHQAMGFRIALARCFRRDGQNGAAETIMDSVQFDLMRFGCSERTFLAFLNEAGRVLMQKNDPIRAYISYLRPSLNRAAEKHFGREAAQASFEAARALEKILIQYKLTENSREDEAERGWKYTLEQAESAHNALIKNTYTGYNEHQFSKDPLFSYALVDVEQVISELMDKASIERQMFEVKNMVGLYDRASS